MKSWTLLLAVVAALTLTGCGGISMTNTPPANFTIGGTVSGMASGSVLVLQNNNANNLTVNGNVGFTFASPVASGSAYNVTVLNQPAGEACTVANGSGTATGNVSNVTVTCTPNPTFTIGGTITGLTSSGLVLQNNLRDNLTVAANATAFTFHTALPSGNPYSVTVLTQPSGQTCTPSNNTGTINHANVTSVVITCTATATFTIGGTISGLTASGLVLQNNLTDNLTVSANATTFTFATRLPSGSAYSVTVLTQPSGLTCTPTNNTGTVNNANVTSVVITCSAVPTFTIGGTITGLTASGLVLQNNLTNNLTVLANATTFTFSTPLPNGSAYSVTVLTQPSGETCTPSNNTGTVNNANVTSVVISCTANPTFTIGGTISGLTASGLVLQDNLSDNLAVPANATAFTFATPLPNGSAYSVTVQAQPTGETCTPSNNTGTVNNANVTSVVITCTATGTFTIGGTISGLTASGLVLQDNLTDNLTVLANATTFTFGTALPNGSAYSVTVLTQPSGETCTPSNNTGTVNNANVTSVVISCSASTGANQWNFINGAQVVSTPGTYPSKKGGTGTPGARFGASTWIDSSGNKWLFGGIGYAKDPAVESYLNDLWKFNGTSWIWVAGSNATQQAAVYPTAVGGAGTPGARAFANSWIDSSNNLWMFGGYGLDALNFGPMNDLWEFNGTQWLWQGGSQTFGAKGVYPVNTGGTGTPGARYNASGAKDSAGNFWLFGGVAFDSNGNQGDINDLWEFTGGQWFWQSGAKTNGQKGTYPANLGGNGTPGARQGQFSWMDASNNFWIFSGNGIDSNANEFGYLNDTWEFNGSQWTWENGSNIINQPSVSLGLGITDPSNVPASRYFSSGWLDPSGDVWILGGQQVGGVELNDLWKFSGGEWTWESGSEADNPPDPLGIYTNPGATPGARQQAASWADTSGNLWLFGGFGWGNVDSTTSPDGLNDLWEFIPGTGPAPALPASQVPHAKRRRPARQQN